ncbi:hypothetical protein BKA70DRAFT_1234631 [Coprinopsis sp. MPI-PUGE-AT-0042]|nr:hypothetical protein BKA70DRAFT_1234631 [Coprinopsis sp. MPI-PUGE-AT-0042]
MYRKYRESLGFVTARKQRHTPETIRDDMVDLRAKYPRAGERDMVAHLFHEKSKAVAGGYFHVYEPHLVAGGKEAPPQERFGLRLHIAVDPFPGRIQWLKIWHTNSNPNDTLILPGVYSEFPAGQWPHHDSLDTGPGTKVPCLHPAPLEAGQEEYPPEIAWSGFRARFAPGFEDLLQLGLDHEWYDPDNLIHRYVFRWIFIPWLQAELDNYRFKVNHTRRRRDPRKVVPHGRAEDIYRFPEAYGARDFKVAVSEEVIREVEERLIPPNLPLFQLVPPVFDQSLRYLYAHLPAELKPFGRHNVWAAYRYLLYQMQTWGAPHHGDAVVFHEGEVAAERELRDVQVIPGQPLLEQQVPGAAPGQHAYLGGVNNGLGIGDELQRDVFDDEGGNSDLDEMELEAFTGYEDARGQAVGTQWLPSPDFPFLLSWWDGGWEDGDPRRQGRWSRPPNGLPVARVVAVAWDEGDKGWVVVCHEATEWVQKRAPIPRWGRCDHRIEVRMEEPGSRWGWDSGHAEEDTVEGRGHRKQVHDGVGIWDVQKRTWRWGWRGEGPQNGSEEADAWEGGDSGRRGRSHQDGRGRRSEMKGEPRSGGYAERDRPPKRVTNRQSGTKGETKCEMGVMHHMESAWGSDEGRRQHYTKKRKRKLSGQRTVKRGNGGSGLSQKAAL